MMSAPASVMAERQPQPIGRHFDDLGLQRHAVAQIGDHHHRDIELAADQQVLEVVAIVLDRGDLDAGKGAAVARQDVGQHIAGDQRGDAELQPPARCRLGSPEGAARIRHVGEDLRRVAQELVALVGDVEAARMALEQRRRRDRPPAP